jgi:radical SAM superfamily enzyme YgiQ (UPF0313 family)
MNPLKKISRTYDPITGIGERIEVVKGERRRRLHKAFLRYHDPNNWPLLREALLDMGQRRSHRQRQAPAHPQRTNP